MRNRKLKSISEINVTNLVDVTMVLLIIFMISAPTLLSGFKVQLPEADGEPLTNQQNLIITLTRDDQIFIEEEKIAAQDFASILKKKWLARGQCDVLLQADRDLSYGKVIRFMGTIHTTGIHNLGLIVDPGEMK